MEEELRKTIEDMIRAKLAKMRLKKACRWQKKTLVQKITIAVDVEVELPCATFSTQTVELLDTEKQWKKASEKQIEIDDLLQYKRQV